MILTVDVGNSNIVCVLYSREGERLWDTRHQTMKNPQEGEYREFFANHKYRSEREIQGVIVSCVVPHVFEEIRQAVTEVYEDRVVFLDTYTLDDFEIRLDNPRELGADLLATSYAAREFYPQPVIVADLGSASKLTAVQGDVFLGGLIMQGIGNMARTLHMTIPHLPEIPLVRPQKVIGNDTIECIQSGIINGAFASVAELARQMEEEIGRPCKKLLTGGYAKLYPLFSDHSDFEYNEFLLSDGLFFVMKELSQRKESPPARG